MSNLVKKTKSLLILDLNGVLGYMSKNHTKVGSLGVYTDKNDAEAKPIHVDHNLAIYERPNISSITFELLVRKKKHYDIGVWSSAGFDDTKLLVEHLFGRYYT